MDQKEIDETKKVAANIEKNYAERKADIKRKTENAESALYNLYAQKGEAITKIGIYQEQLKEIDRKILDIFTKSRIT